MNMEGYEKADPVPTTTLKEARNAALKYQLHIEVESKLQILKSNLQKDKERLDLLLTEIENDDESHYEESVDLEYKIVPQLEREIARLEHILQAQNEFQKLSI